MHSQTRVEPNWYAVYTYPKAEKKVYSKVKEMGGESFLPTQLVVRQWSDRKKKLEVPLFPNYVFVKTTPLRRFDFLKIKELVNFVTFEGIPVAIPEKEINTIKTLLSGQLELFTEEYDFKRGEKVKIREGNFVGAEGFIIRKNGKKRLIVQIEALQQALSIEIATECVDVIS